MRLMPLFVKLTQYDPACAELANLFRLRANGRPVSQARITQLRGIIAALESNYR